jgi:hypothetical protein
VERCIMEAKVPDHEPGIGKDGCDGDGFGQTTYCCCPWLASRRLLTQA